LNTFNTHNLLDVLADSVVVITGASSGMGKEIAYRYAERGCKIVIAARKIKDLEKVSEFE
jgi:NADP-dependent 3-hydroxy acid dehydrogenase YdfG